MKRFNEFVNESVRDLLTGKSKEEIQDVIKNMHILKRLSDDVPEEYKPTQKELEDNINEIEEYIEEKLKQLNMSFEDLFGGIKDKDYDYIIEKFKELKEKNSNNTIKNYETIFSETILNIFHNVETSGGDENSYEAPFDHRRLGFIKNMINMVGGQKIINLLKKRI